MPKAAKATQPSKAAASKKSAAKKASPAKSAAAKKSAPAKAAAKAAKAAKATKATKQPSKKAPQKGTTTAKSAPSAAPKAAAKKAPAKKAAPATPAKAGVAPSIPTKKKAATGSGPVKRPPARAASAGDAKFFAEQRALLLEEREGYERQAAALKAEADQLAAEMEPGDVQFDEESGEGDSIGMERERDLQLAGQARAAVEEIDRALQKIVSGTYGLCERCGQPIPKARLKALPYAALCVACKSGGLSSRR